MKVLFDYQAFSMQRYGGVSKCFCELMRAFDSDLEYDVSIKYSNNIHLRTAGICGDVLEGNDYYSFLPGCFFKGKKRLYLALEKMNIIHSMDKLNLEYSIKYLKEHSYDVFHPTYYNPYFLDIIGNVPFVITVHDMMPELFPQYYKSDDNQIVWKKVLVNKAQHIIAVSNNTKNDIIRLMGVDPQKISVVYHGGPSIRQPSSKSPLDNPYFLFVGMRSGYKNFKQTVVDFGHFYKDNRDFRLVCVGMPFEKQERLFIKSLGLSNSVIQISANDEELVTYYSHAVAFVYPSLYEGFGLPILESFANGCPVILNNTSCFPEIAGKAAVYFDIKNGASTLTDALYTISRMRFNERQSLIASGYNRLNSFSWGESAKQLEAVYKRLV